MYEEIVKKLIEKKRTVATMESCTSGAVASEITNVSGSSEILKVSLVTYSNEYKIKFGVDKNIIDKYSVYSIETAKEMAKKVSDFASSYYGIGVTGKFNEPDPSNKFSRDDLIFVCIYDSVKEKYFTLEIQALNISRKDNKNYVVKKIGEIFKDILNLEGKTM